MEKKNRHTNTSTPFDKMKSAFCCCPLHSNVPQEAPNHPHTGLPSSPGAHTTCGNYHLGAGEVGEFAHRLGLCVPKFNAPDVEFAGPSSKPGLTSFRQCDPWPAFLFFFFLTNCEKTCIARNLLSLPFLRHSSAVFSMLMLLYYPQQHPSTTFFIL